MRSEYDPGGAQARAEARHLFLQAVRDCELNPLSQEPERGRPCRVLSSLRGTPLQRFRSLYDCTRHALSYNLLQWNLCGGEWTEESAAKWSQLFNSYAQISGYDVPVPNLMNNISPAQYFTWLSLRESLAEWARSWDLDRWEGNDPWFFDLALSTLYLWCASPEAREEMCWALVSYSIESLPVQDLRVKIEIEVEADLTAESRAAAKKRLMRGAEKAIDDFLNGLEALEEGRGAARSKDIRGREPFEMLVRYVVQKWPTEAVRAAFGYENPENVSGANNRTARLIGLTLPARRGRPRKL